MTLQANQDWTKPFHGVSHKMVDNTQFTIEDHGTFATGFVFSWATCRMVIRDLHWSGPTYLSDAKTEMEKKAHDYTPTAQAGRP